MNTNDNNVNIFRAIFERAIQHALDEAGLDALKKTSLFGSNHK